MNDLNLISNLVWPFSSPVAKSPFVSFKHYDYKVKLHSKEKDIKKKKKNLKTETDQPTQGHKNLFAFDGFRILSYSCHHFQCTHIQCIMQLVNGNMIQRMMCQKAFLWGISCLYEKRQSTSLLSMNAFIKKV